MQAYAEWAKGASEEEKHLAWKQIARTKGGAPAEMAEYMGMGPSEKQINDAALEEAGKVGTEAGTQVKTIADAEWAKGGWGGYLIKNPSLLMLPLGLMIALTSRKKMGKLLGVMAMAGGAANLYGRHKAMTDPAFLTATQRMAAMKQADLANPNGPRAWTPEMQQEYDSQHGTAWLDLQAANQAGLVNLPKMGGEAATSLVQSTLPGQVQVGAQ